MHLITKEYKLVRQRYVESELKAEEERISTRAAAVADWAAAAAEARLRRALNAVTRDT